MEKQIIQLKNGEKIAYIEQGKGKKNLLLIHGNTSSSLYFSPLFERLPHDIYTIAPDLRGFGDSSYYQHIKSLLDLADDLKKILDEKHIHKVNVLGWSLGGGVAMEFAAKYPDMVESLILVGSTTHKGYPIFKKNREGKPIFGEVYSSREELSKDPVQVTPLLEAQKHKNVDFMSYIYDLTIYTHSKPTKEQNNVWVHEALKQRCLVDVDWALAQLNMSDIHNFYSAGTQNIQNIKAKTLHLWGKKDLIVPEYMVLENYKALENQSTFKIYEDCGHSPFVDVPDEITEDILNFIT